MKNGQSTAVPARECLLSSFRTYTGQDPSSISFTSDLASVPNLLLTTPARLQKDLNTILPLFFETCPQCRRGGLLKMNLAPSLHEEKECKETERSNAAKSPTSRHQVMNSGSSIYSTSMSIGGPDRPLEGGGLNRHAQGVAE